MIRRYTLDTNIPSDLARHLQGQIVEQTNTVDEKRGCTSLIMCRGAALPCRQVRLRAFGRATRILGAIDVLPLKPPLDASYGDLRARLERTGNLIGPHDLLIVPQALPLDGIMIPDKEREFSRVDGLTLVCKRAIGGFDHAIV